MYRILVVDDEPMIRMGLTKLITQADPSVILTETAGNGIEALEAIQQARPDFIFTDIRMPKMDGLELMLEKQRGYFPLSKLEAWLEQLELAVWHLQMNEIQVRLQEIEEYCQERELESIQLQDLLGELYAKLIKQLNSRDIYTFERIAGFLKAESGNPGNMFQAFRQAVEQTVQQIRAKRKGNAKEPVEEAKAYIERNLSKDLSLDEVSDMLGLNPSYFSQLFKQMTDETFVHYRIKKRMEMAKKLLAIPHYKITDISFEVGYADHPHFTKTFKKFTGYTPSEYRELLGIE
ncbi:helix-turn-helix domain-containing protein [Paenibacillus sp. FSL K6-1566]|uniref:response regulator transcription factor n=1 Tax=Paenibacillus sp. FSL K6-1566 TaxID=2954515 RepID=UPI003100E34D